MTLSAFEFERQAIEDGYKIVCGVDEAGRGPLAGAVYAAAVILPVGIVIDGLDDSKKLSEKKRDAVFEQIIEKSVSFCIASADEKEIDEMNILNATFLAMKRAISGLSPAPDIALIDGNRASGFDVPVRTIVGGDGKCPSIAAASILAKVSRDRYMKKMAHKYPEYGFEIHKGYPTKAHRDKILKIGPCDIHRKTFLKKIASGGKE